MTRPAASAALAALLLVTMLPLAAPTAEAAPVSFTINVVSARSLGCSPDFFTPPDLRVRVLVDGAPVHTTMEASQQSEPLYAVALPASATLPVTIGIEAEEAEPSRFFGTSTTYVACSVAPGGATRAEFTYDGEAALTRLLRGDDSRAAEVYVVVGTGAPPAPTVRASATDTTATLRWDADPTGQASGHRVARGGVGALVTGATVTGNEAVVGGLCDNSAYAFRVVRDTTTWHVSSADVSFTTSNAAPHAPAVLSATREGNVTFDSPTTHDVARYEIHASPSPTFAPSNATLRHTVSPSFLVSRQVAATGVPFAAADAYALARVVDTGGLHADSTAYAIGGASRSSPYGASDGCRVESSAGSSTGGAPSGGTSGDSATSGDTSQAPTGSSTDEDAEEPCCYAFAWSFGAGVGDAPRVTSGGSVNLTLRNTGTLALTIQLRVVDHAGDVRFLTTNDPVSLPAGASRRVEVRVAAIPEETARAGVDAAIEIHAVESGEIQEAALLVDVPSRRDDLAWERLSEALQVEAPSDTQLVPLGGSLEVTVRLTNLADHELTVETVTLMARRAGSAAPLMLVAGYDVVPEPAFLRLAPRAQAELAVTLTAPASGRVGDVVEAPLTLRTSNSVAIQDIPVTFRVQAVAPEMVVVADAPEGANLDSAALATVGAIGGAAACVGAVLWTRRDASRYLLAVALYARLAPSETLAHPRREELRRLIEQEPGICYSTLKRETGMNTGALVHHLRALERAGLVASRREGAFRRFYSSSTPRPLATLVPVDPTLTPAQAKALAILREAPLTQGELAARLGLSQQGTNHHVKALERAGHVEARFDGRAWRYHAVDPVGVPR